MSIKIRNLYTKSSKKVAVGTCCSSEQDISEMARVGYTDDNKLEVLVYTNDGGSTPHIHVIDKSPISRDPNKANICIQLERPKYFIHGNHKGTLNSSQRKSLNKFMHQPPNNGKFTSNYEYAVILWNDNNSDKGMTLKTDENGEIIIPDYSSLE